MDHKPQRLGIPKSQRKKESQRFHIAKRNSQVAAGFTERSPENRRRNSCAFSQGTPPVLKLLQRVNSVRAVKFGTEIRPQRVLGNACFPEDKGQETICAKSLCRESLNGGLRPPSAICAQSCTIVHFCGPFGPLSKGNFRRKMTTIVGNCGQLWTSTLSPHLLSPHLDIPDCVPFLSSSPRAGNYNSNGLFSTRWFEFRLGCSCLGLANCKS